MHCSNCGLEAAANDLYCAGCGEKLLVSDPVTKRLTSEEETISSVIARSGRARSLSNSKGTLYFGITASVVMLGMQVFHAYVHEMLGHGVVALLIGQQLNGFYISPFGSSYTFASMSSVPSLAALQYAAGTLVSVPLGIVLLYLVYPWIKRKGSSFGVRFATLIFIIMLESDLLYGFSSPLVQYGDVNDLARILSIQPSSVLSLGFFVLALAVYYPVLREYLELLAPFAGKDILLRKSARFKLLLKATFVPVLFILIEEFVGVGVISTSAGLFYVIGVAVLVSPLLPASYVISHYYDPSKRAQNVQNASSVEARLAFNDLLKVAIIFIVFMAATEIVFGPIPRIVSSV